MRPQHQNNNNSNTGSNPGLRSPATSTTSASSTQNVTLDMVFQACRNCRIELQRLASLIEREGSSSSTSSSPSKRRQEEEEESGGFFDSLSHFVKEAGIVGGDEKNNNSSNNKKRQFEEEYYALAKSCREAAKISELEATALRDSLRMVQSFKEAAERERDNFEEKLIQHQKVVDALQQEQFASARAKSQEEEMGEGSSSSGKFIQNQQQEQQQKREQTSSSSSSSSTATTSSPLFEECTTCISLRQNQLQLEEHINSLRKRVTVLDAEVGAKDKKLANIESEWKEKLRTALSASQSRAEAIQRKTAAGFLQRQCAATAASTNKLLETELQLSLQQEQIGDLNFDLMKVRADKEHGEKTSAAKIQKLERDNEELHRILNKLLAATHASSSSSSSPSREGNKEQQEQKNNNKNSNKNNNNEWAEWSPSDDRIAEDQLGSEGRQEAFHLWLLAASDSQSHASHHPEKSINVESALQQETSSEHNNNSKEKNKNESSSSSATTSSSSSSTGIIEAARRLLSRKLATKGFVDIEDETVARALHSTNETLRVALEENMRLHMLLQKQNKEKQ